MAAAGGTKQADEACAELSDTEGAAAIVLPGHDSFQRRINLQNPSCTFHVSNNQEDSNENWKKEKKEAH